MKEVPKSRLTNRFILYIVGMSILPILVLYLTATSVAEKVITQHAVSDSQVFTAQCMAYLELTFSEVESLIGNVSSREEIIGELARDADNSAIGDYKRLATQSRIGYILGGYTNLQGLISIDIFAVNGQHYHVGDTLDIKSIRSDVKDRLFQEAREAAPRVVWAGIEDNVNAHSEYRKVIAAAKVLTVIDPDTYREKPVALIIVNYDPDILYTQLIAHQIEKDAYLIVIDPHKRIVYHPNKTLIGTRLDPVLEPGLDQNMQYAAVNGQEMLITHSHSLKNKWSALSLIPVASLAEGPNQIRSISLIVLAFLMAMVALLAIQISRKVVTPIKEITHHFQMSKEGSFEGQVRIDVKSNDEIGELAVWFNAFLDSMIEKERAEAALSQSKEQYRNLVENMSEVVFQTDLAGNALFLNPAWEEITGYGVRETIGVNLLQYIHADDRPVMRKALKDSLEQEEKINHLTLRCVTRGGAIRWIEMYTRLMKNWKDDNVGVTGTFDDITERMEAIEALRKAKEAAESADRAKSEFLANMSHEIRTPMNVVIGMADLLMDAEHSAEEQEQIKLIRNAGQSLLTILNDILDFSKIEAGKLEIEEIDFNPRTLAEGAVELLAWKAREKNLTLRCCVDEDVPPVLRGDPGRMRQILVNLISNAVKFTDQGEVAVHVMLKEKSDSRAVIVFQVRDTGIGIGEQELANLFQPFTQADGSMSRKFGGTGLGLSITKRLTELMKGTVQVTSQPGVGSVFEVVVSMEYKTEDTISSHAEDRLLSDRNMQASAAMSDSEPVRSVRPAAESVIVPRAEKELQPETRPVMILVAEDNPDNQKLVRLFLKKLGYEMKIANNGQEAFQEATAPESSCAILLMDCQMPVMDGFEASRAIRLCELQSGKHLPIVAMTANAMQGDREKCLEAGMDDYISKPINQQELERVIRKWM